LAPFVIAQTVRELCVFSLDGDHPNICGRGEENFDAERLEWQAA